MSLYTVFQLISADANLPEWHHSYGTGHGCSCRMAPNETLQVQNSIDNPMAAEELITHYPKIIQKPVIGAGTCRGIPSVNAGIDVMLNSIQVSPIEVVPQAALLERSRYTPLCKDT